MSTTFWFAGLLSLIGVVLLIVIMLPTIRQWFADSLGVEEEDLFGPRTRFTDYFVFDMILGICTEFRILFRELAQKLPGWKRK